MGGGGGITSKALGIFSKVDIFTLVGGVQEAKVGIPIVAPRQLVNLSRVSTECGGCNQIAHLVHRRHLDLTERTRSPPFRDVFLSGF
jgi:hypothetical protein